MGELHVDFQAPAPGATVARWLVVSGSIRPQNPYTTEISGVHIQLGAGGAWQQVSGTTAWSWQGYVPNAIRPGEPFVVTVSAQGSNSRMLRPGEPDVYPVDGQQTRALVLESKLPVLTIDPFHPTVATSGQSTLLTVSGSVGHEGPVGVYGVPTLRYRVDGGPFTVIPSAAGRWSLPLNLSRGEHSLEVTAWDGYGSVRGTGRRAVRVLTYLDSARSEPADRTTASGVPTTSSITSWTRIEPEVTGADVGASAALRVFDPVWMLTRQWQMGEYQGEDTGSPVKARMRAESAMLSHWHPGALQASGPGLPYSPRAAPLEALVEAVKTRAGGTTEPSTLLLAVDGGLHFLRMLNADAKARKYAAAFRQRYSVEAVAADVAPRLDPASRDLMATLRGRALDGRRLAAALRSGTGAAPNIEGALGIVAADLPSVRAVAGAWLAWNAELLHEPADSGGVSWAPDRLEYTASVAAAFSPEPGAGVTLTATQHEGGRLDWHSFDSETELKLETPGALQASRLVQTVVPAPVHVHGTPAQRLWEFEDGHVAYGLLATDPSDIAQMMLVEYTGSYGNDWYVVPLTLPVGSITRVSSLVVVDTFGVQCLVRPMGDPALAQPHFSMWQMSRRSGAQAVLTGKEANLFFLPPTAAMPLESTAVEELHLVRDEMANVAWAIEVAVEGANERPTRLADRLPPRSPNEADAGLGKHYRLWSTVPAHWHPVLPVPHGQPDQVGGHLKVGRAMGNDGSLRPWQIQGRLMSALRDSTLRTEEVARGGLQLSRRRKLTRWINGSTWLWSVQRTDVGRAEPPIQLRFDAIVESD